MQIYQINIIEAVLVTLAVYAGCILVWPQLVMQILTEAFNPPFPRENYVIGSDICALPNGISFCPTALSNSMSVTDI